MGDERVGDLIDEAVRAVLGTDALGHAINGLVRVLSADYALWSAAILMLTPEGTGRIVATWSAAPTVLEVGTEIALDLTPTTLEMASTLLRGEALAFDPGLVDLGMIGDVVAREGERSLAVAPLREEDVVIAMLSFASSRANAFAEADLALITGIASGIEDHVLALIEEES